MKPDTGLLQADRTARETALDIERSFIVQAPAGSGKTELLIQRYLKLLATVDSPEEILAITFTRKAAAEMRLRIVDALERANRGDVPLQDHLRITATAANEVLERDQQLGWRLIPNAQRMRIQTLDALNASIARMQPLTQGATGAINTVAENSKLDALYATAAAATLDWLGDNSEAGQATETVLRHVDNNTRRYVEYLSRMLRTRDQWLPFVSSGLHTLSDAYALRAALENSLARILADNLDELRDCMPRDAAAEFLALGAYAAHNLIADGNAASPISIFDKQVLPPAALAGADAETLENALSWWCGVAELLLIKDGNIRKQVIKTQGFPPGDDGQKARMKAVLDELAAEPEFAIKLHAARSLPPPVYSDEQWAVLLALFQLLPVAVAEFRRFCLAQGVTDHIEIALSAGTALGSAEQPGDIALLLDYQVRHILVDEMQDTSKAQYRMLEAMTGGWESGDGRTLFVVGDPMQSIYRFRNAEVAQFLMAREKGIGSVRLQPLLLRRNFRSGSRLVDWYNRAFPAVLPAQDDITNGAVSYSRSVSVEQQEGKGECVVHPLFGGSIEAEALVGRDIIQSIHQASEDESIAVLVRSRTQLPTLLRKLRDAKIPYQAIDIDRLSDLPEIIDVLALTRAMLHVGDRVAWLAVLRSPWVGLDWTDLHTLVNGSPHLAVPELLADNKRIAGLSRYGRKAVDGFLTTIGPHLQPDRSSSLQLRVEKAWFALGGPALLSDANDVANVYHFFDTLAKLEIGGSIPDTVELMRQLNDVRVSSSVASQVQILTMHKAKGLQFDHVILYGLGRYPSSNRKSVLSWFDLPDEHGNEDKIISPIGRQDEIEHDALHQFIELRRNAKDDFEKSRLLYVACTRAKKTLHLLGNVALNTDGDSFKLPYKTSLLNLLWPIVADEYAQAFSMYQVPLPADDIETLVQPPLRRLTKPWRTPALEELPGVTDCVETLSDNQTVNYEWVGADARLAGTVTHRWLQLISKGRAKITPDSVADIREISKRWLNQLGASDADVEAICDRVELALLGVLLDEKGRWLLEGPGDAELALSGRYDGRVRSIMIDRIRIDEDGTHWVVDYKTSSHEGGDLEGFLRAESERYREQLRKYAALYRAWCGKDVRTALYFPLLQKFIEVSV